MSNARPRRVAPLALLLLFACATPAPRNAATDSPPVRSEEGGESTRLTAAEIRAASLPNAYELVSRLRRPWLRRDAVSGGEVKVYLENRDIGGAEALRAIPAVDVAELRFLDNDAAVRRWGNGVRGSVIEVIRS